MGLTCTSLHVFSRIATPATAAMNWDPLAQGLADRLDSDLIDNSGDADRQLVAIADAPWISVFDLSDPDAVTADSFELGKHLSAAAQAPVLLTSVWDSDAFAFALFEKGKQVDGYATMRGVLPGRIKKWTAEKRGAEWSRLFDRPITVENLQAITEKGLLFADDLLVRLCDLLGLSARVAALTAKDLGAKPLPNQHVLNLRTRPGAAGRPPVTQTIAYRGATLTEEVAKGQTQGCPFQIDGPAGAFADPVVEISGPAVDCGLVSLDDVYGLWALGMEGIRAGKIYRVNAALSVEDTAAGRRLRARLTGLSAPRFDFPPRKKSILSVWVIVRAEKAGAAEFQVSFTANSNSAEQIRLRPSYRLEVS